MIFNDRRDFVWSEVPDPVRKSDEVLIRVHAAAINRADLMQKDGCYASPPEWPQWCGLEVSGEVVEYTNCADRTRDWSHCVGYAGIAFR